MQVGRGVFVCVCARGHVCVKCPDDCQKMIRCVCIYIVRAEGDEREEGEMW